jgi:hypothetical protein
VGYEMVFEGKPESDHQAIVEGSASDGNEEDDKGGEDTGSFGGAPFEGKMSADVSEGGGLAFSSDSIWMA